MGSFDGINFSERGTANGAMLPIHGAEVSTNVIPIPGGPIVYLQVGQPKPVSFSLPVRVTTAQLHDLRAAVNTSATLIYTGGSGAATLEEVSEPQKVKPATDYLMVTLQFKIRDSAFSSAPSGALTSDSGALLLTDGGAYIIAG